MSMRLCAVLLVLSGTMLAQQAPVGYDDTPMQPNGTWRVHDGKRPQPRMKQPIKLDFLWAGLCLVGAVYFIFRA